MGAVDHRPELDHLERLAVEAGAALPVEDRALRVELDRERGERPERQRHDQPERRDGDVEAALDQRRRARRVPGLVLEHRQVGDPREADGPGAAVERRDHAQLHLALAAGGDDVADLARLHPLGREDHAVDAVDDLVERLVSLVCEQLEVHVGEEDELAPDHLGEVAVAEHGGHLARGPAPPDPARSAAQAERADQGDEEGGGGRVPLDRAGAGLREDQREHPDPDARPDGERRDLVDGQVADRDVVAVIEAEQLRDQDPGGQQRDAPEDVRGRPGDDDRRRRGGDQVGERRASAAGGRHARSAGARAPRLRAPTTLRMWTRPASEPRDRSDASGNPGDPGK